MNGTQLQDLFIAKTWQSSTYTIPKQFHVKCPIKKN